MRTSVCVWRGGEGCTEGNWCQETHATEWISLSCQHESICFTMLPHSHVHTLVTPRPVNWWTSPVLITTRSPGMDILSTFILWKCSQEHLWSRTNVCQLLWEKNKEGRFFKRLEGNHKSVKITADSSIKSLGRCCFTVVSWLKTVCVRACACVCVLCFKITSGLYFLFCSNHGNQLFWLYQSSFKNASWSQCCCGTNKLQPQIPPSPTQRNPGSDPVEYNEKPKHTIHTLY